MLLISLGIFKIYSIVYNWLKLLKFNHKNNVEEFKNIKKKVIITGCTDGIGKGYSMYLAKLGIESILLISRSSEKLANVENCIKEVNKNINTTTFTYDFSNVEYADLENAIKNFGGADLLINNVGVSYEHPTYFHELTPDEISNMINVNLVSAYKMIFLTKKHTIKHEELAIMNLGSGMIFFPSAFYSLYAATKNGLNGLSIAMAENDKNIFYQNQNPCLVSTKMVKTTRKSFFCPSTAVFAKDSIDYLFNTVINKKPNENYNISSPYKPHNFQIWLFSQILPYSIVKYMFISYFLKIMNKAKAKKQKQQKN